MPRGVRDSDRAARQKAIVRRVLLRAMRKGWTVDKVAAVILASLTPSRVTAGVVGPCFYCGDDLAATVDHLRPVIDGGTDDTWNVVSSCLPCNVAKGTQPLDLFLRYQPRGSRRELERRVIAARAREWREREGIA